MNADDMDGLDEATRKEVEALQEVTRERDGNETYAEAQFEIGSIYLKNNNLESALKAWDKVKHSDNPEFYAQLRVNIGIMFKKQGDFERALVEWNKVERSDSAETYARAQLYISHEFNLKGDKKNTLLALRNIEYSDNHKLYASAQLNIGFTLLESDDNEGALKVWHNIKRSDDPATFAKAQINIGQIYHQNNDAVGALAAWNSILLTDHNEVYANAQFNIGHEFEIMGNIDGALNIWSEIKRSDHPTFYAMAQFNIGAALRKQNNNEGALLAWRNIARSDDSESFAKAKFSIGIILNEQNRKDSALTEWRSVYRKDDNEIFAQAQFNIGCELSGRDDFQGAFLAWNAIGRSDNPEIYARARTRIGFLLEKRQDHKGAVTEWSKIERSDDAEAYAVAQANIGYLSFNTPTVAKKAFLCIRETDNPRVYAHAQFKLGLIFIDEYNIEEAKKSFDVAKSYYPYESYCYEKICELIKVPETENFGLSSLKLFNVVLGIVDILTLDFSKYSDEEKPFERKLAHYTSTYTCNLLLGNEQKATTPSLFRLNTINNVNDPSEGQLLIRKLKGIKNNNFTALDFNEEFHAFISCFTFNHDSLNQFRLYGKQDNKEASGMSLVFKKEFFQSQNFIGGLSHLSVENSSKLIKNISNITDTKLDNIKMQAFADNEVAKYSVMRCVYLDPTSEYFHLAQRNRLTFFREFGDKTIIKNGIKQSQAEYEWGIYQDYIKIITDKFETAYENLKITYKEIEAEINSVRFILGSLKQKELNTLLDEILLPLKYLIKHSAFREEQECRMIYITSIDRPEVTMEYGSFLYVEYEPSVKDHLDKIYIAPAALQHKRYFDYLLADIDVPVEVSLNVFR